MFLFKKKRCQFGVVIVIGDIGFFVKKFEWYTRPRVKKHVDKEEEKEIDIYLAQNRNFNGEKGESRMRERKLKNLW